MADNSPNRIVQFSSDCAAVVKASQRTEQVSRGLDTSAPLLPFFKAASLLHYHWGSGGQ